MTTDNTGATHLFQLSRWRDDIISSSYLPLNVGASGPGQKDSKASRHVYRYSDAIHPRPLIVGYWPVEPLHRPPSALTVPNPNGKTSHDCQTSPLYINPYPAQSVVQEPPFEPQQGQRVSDSPWPDASPDEDILLNGSQGQYPPLCLTTGLLSSETPSLASGMGSSSLSESFGVASTIPEERKYSALPTSNSPVVNTVPSRQSREDRHDRNAWMPQAETNRYRDNAIIPYGLQSTSFQLSHRPRRKPRYPVPDPYIGAKPMPSLSWSSPGYASTNYSSSPPLHAPPQPQSRAENAEGRTEKKYWCSRVGCGRGYTLPQVLGRHMKDMHDTKLSCSHCVSKGVSFMFSRGRPYVYRKHLESKHPEIAPKSPEVRPKASRYAKESLNMGAMQAHNANYIPPRTMAAPLQDTSYLAWDK